VAIDGVEAVDIFRENADKVQLVLMDVVMPKKSGKEAYEEIRGIRPRTKVIFTSGYTADLISNRKIIEEGMDYLSKPFMPQELFRKIREVLDR
jgi:DNA-binding response OmpR family regulator